MAAGGIQVEGVRRSFSGVHALVDASLDAPPGAVTGLIGPNGSGKTTLMLILASLLRPDSGTVRVDGIDPVADPAGARRALGWMPDILGSWVTLTVRETLVTTGRLHGLGKEPARERAAELIGTIGLELLADRPTRVLSRGQKQKLSLARALVHDPSVLLLDEPASGLDPAARIELRVLVRRLADEGRTVLVSSHVLAELDEMADGAVYLENGATASAERLERARTSLREWRIRTLDPGEQGAGLVAAAARAAGVEAERMRADHQGLLVQVTGEAEAAALLAALVAGGVRVSAFAPAVGDLEHTFLDLGREHLA